MKTAIRKTLGGIAAILSMFSALFWQMSAQLTVKIGGELAKAPGNTLVMLNVQSANLNLYAGWFAAASSLLLCLALFLE
jgi:hypothetical protein